MEWVWMLAVLLLTEYPKTERERGRGRRSCNHSSPIRCTCVLDTLVAAGWGFWWAGRSVSLCEGITGDGEEFWPCEELEGTLS